MLGGVLAVSAVAALLPSRGSSELALIYSNGALIESINLYALSQPRSIIVGGETGVNVIEVKRGSVRVSEADCPDGFCVSLGWVDGGAIPIVCLPHKLVISFEGTVAPEVDAVAG